MKFKEFKNGDFTIRFYSAEGKPDYDYLEIGISQGGYYGVDTEIDFTHDELDEFLEECLRYKKYRDNNKKSER